MITGISPLGQIVLLIALVIVVFSVANLPRMFDSEGKSLGLMLSRILDEYLQANAERDLQKRELMFHKLTISIDRVLSHILYHYGNKDQSVKSQLRSALQRKLLTYEQFTVLKNFHHMRNEVVHEGLQVNGSNEQLVYTAITTMRSLLG